MSTSKPGNSLFDKLTLVKAEKGDEEFLAELYCSTRQEEFSHVGWDDAQLSQFLVTQYNFQKQSYDQQFPTAEQSVIWVENKNAGRLIVYRSEAQIRLVDISLLPQFRNSGIGTKIITGLMDEANERGLPVALQVAVINQSAFRLYQKLGFRVTAEDAFYLAMEWHSDFES